MAKITLTKNTGVKILDTVTQKSVQKVPNGRRTKEEIEQAVSDAANEYFSSKNTVTGILKKYRISTSKFYGKVSAELYKDPSKSMRYEGGLKNAMARILARSGNKEAIAATTTVTKHMVAELQDVEPRLIKNKILG